MRRVSREQMFLDMARAASRRSTCYRLSVGAIIVRDGNVVSIGYNGAPTKQPHCSGHACPYYTPNGCTVVHAERNAIERAPDAFATFRGTLYCTHSPCQSCAELIVKVSIARVFYEIEYRDRSPLEYLTREGVDVYRVLPSGYCVAADGHLVELT